MALINPSELKDSYDVIVVGSGAGGGQSAYTLTMEGASVLMIEAGRNYDPVRETAMFQTNADAPLRGVGTPDKPRGFHDATVDGGWQVPGEPYTNASSKPEEQFMWWRSRMLGGRTNHWGRISLRNGPYDFKPRSRDGLGFDWPLTYEDIAPYYDKVEMLVGGVWRQRGHRELARFSTRRVAPTAQTPRRRTTRAQTRPIFGNTCCPRPSRRAQHAA